MKTILCYGDSNVRGVIPEKIINRSHLVKVRDKNKRWTGILQKLLGDDYDIIEEGMGGRTTAFDEINPGRPYRNGLKDLPLFLEAHFPIDLVIFLLGINDTKIQYNKTAKEITEGLNQCIQVVKNSNKGRDEKAPKILIVTPIPIEKIPNLFPELDDASILKSKALPNLYKKLALENNCEFLDASSIVKASQIDGLHLDEPEHVVFAKVIHEKIKQITL